MFEMKRFRALLLAVLMVCAVLAMSACGDPEAPTEPQTTGTTESTGAPETEPSETEPAGDVNYKITLTDGVGRPYTEKVKVRFAQAGAQVAMAIVNADGVAEKTLPRGDYDIQIESFSSDVSFYYDAAAAKVTADAPELQIVLAQETVDAEGSPIVSVEDIFAGGKDTVAWNISSGSSHVKLAEGERSYFLFVPTEAGTYEFSVAGDAATIGIYGASTHFIQDSSTHEVVDNKITLSVQPSMIGSGATGTTVYVIGLDGAEGITDAVLNVIRMGDPEWSFAEEPWSIYEPKQEIVPYTLPEGITLKPFNLTAATEDCQLVFNEVDGCYHLGTADGPRVFVQLGSSMQGISMMGMVGEIIIQNGVPMQTGSAPFRYSYNNGQADFFKEDYTDAMRQYVTNRDKASGVYPLNEDLYYMLPLGIEQMGWCRPDTANYLFAGQEGINHDIAWMFLLVYEDIPGDPADPTDPTDPTDPSDPSDTTAPSDTTEPTACVHEYAVTEEKAATCTEKGSVTYACALCGDSYSETLVALGHDYSAVTCTEPKICKLCGTTSGEALGHNYNDATCIRAKTCKICGVSEGEPLGHNYIEATCTAPMTCTQCAQTKGEALGHVYEAATCTTGEICKTCGAAGAGALGHRYGEIGICGLCGQKDPEYVDPSCDHVFETTASREPTCTEAGYVEYRCTLCGEGYCAELPVMAHSYLPANCDTPKICEVCGLTGGEALGHSWKDATCAAPKTCDICAATEGEALGHSWRDATCTDAKTCETCGATEGEALGHIWMDATCTDAKTCETCGAIEGFAPGHSWGEATCDTAKTCQVCGVVDGDIPGHSWIDATCTAAKTCSVCGKTEGESLGHNYGTDGNCTRCGAVDPDFEPVIEDNKDEPISIGGVLSFDAEVKGNHLVYYDIYKVSGTYLTIENANAYVVYEGVRYDAVDGVVTIPELYSSHTNSPVSLAIGNTGDDAVFAVKMAYPLGTMMNPMPLEMGTLTVESQAGNDQGVYYLWTATAEGTLTVTLNSKTDGVECKIVLYNLLSGQNEILDSTVGGDSVSVAVKANQLVRIIVGALPDADNNYPAATFELTAALN